MVCPHQLTDSTLKSSKLRRFEPQGNARQHGLPQPWWRSESVCIDLGRRHRWLIPHRRTTRSNADCRPLLQQSSPNRGQVVQPRTTRKGITSRLGTSLATDAGLIDTPLAPPQVPQVPMPAASTDHGLWTIDDALTLGLCSGVFGLCNRQHDQCCCSPGSGFTSASRQPGQSSWPFSSASSRLSASIRRLSMSTAELAPHQGNGPRPAAVLQPTCDPSSAPRGIAQARPSSRDMA